MKLYFYLTFLFLTICFSCKDEPDLLILNEKDVYFELEGGKSVVTITTNLEDINILNEVNWLTIKQSILSNGKKEITINATENLTGILRQTLVILNKGSVLEKIIYVTQKSTLFPNYNISKKNPDDVGMKSTATEIASKIKIGWNIGNTLEATGGETNWGNPKINNELLLLVKNNGFNAVRIPCSWNQNADPNTAAINISWLNRVKEVIDLCIKNEMYVVLNIHWDGGWLENNCTEAKQEFNNAKQKAFWEQIATHFRDYDEHLIFAGANEPNVENEIQMTVLNTYHQTFVDAVRSTGGKNTFRTLVIQGPSTDIDKTSKLFKAMPNDKTPNRLMFEMHYYTPWNFAGLTKDESWGKQFYYWGKDFHSTFDLERNATWGEESTVISNFDLMKKQFTDKNIPVLMGEYGATKRDYLKGEALRLHLASRAYYLAFVTKEAKKRGFIPFYWDNGSLTEGSGIFDRKQNSIGDKEALAGLIEGAN